MPSGEFVPPGETGDTDLPWRIHPETGAEYHALGGTDHKYNKDYKVGSSYPATVFVKAKGDGGQSLSHRDVEDLLGRHPLEYASPEHTTDVLLPKGIEQTERGGPREATWWQALQFRPPGRAPSLRKVAERAEEILGEESVFATKPRHCVEIWVEQ